MGSLFFFAAKIFPLWYRMGSHDYDRASSFYFADKTSTIMKEIAERMICMCKVYEFPIKPELSDKLKGMLEKNARDYIEGINKTLDYVDSVYGDSDNYDAIMVLVHEYFTNVMMQAIEDV